MKSDIPLDYAVFQLSPRRSRCELFVSYDGTTEKLATGSVKPFLNHLKTAEEQFASAAKAIKLEVRRCKKAESWFTKGTFERFVQFVKNPEVLEVVNTFDAEMSQLEAAQKIYSQGSGEGSGSDGGAATASDATKKELLRAIDLRLTAVGQHLSAACNDASTAGFNSVTVLELQRFADQFGAHSLSESCSRFTSLCQRRPELFNTWKYRVNDQAIRSSSGSDMSLDDQANDLQTGSILNQHQISQTEKPDELKSVPLQPANKPSEDMKGSNDRNIDKKEDASLVVVNSEPTSTEVGRPGRRLSVQDRISLFENKQKENSSGSSSKAAVGKSIELRRLSSDVSSAGQMGSEKAVLRRWSGASDMSIDSSGERKDVDGSVVTPTALVKTSSPIISEDIDKSDEHNFGTLLKPETNGIDAFQGGHTRLENRSNSMEDELEAGASQEAFQFKSRLFAGRSESDKLKDQSNVGKQSNASFGRTAEDTGFRNQVTSQDLPRKIDMCSSSEEYHTVKQECVAEKAQLSVSSRRSNYDISNCETFHEKDELDDIQSTDQHVSRSQLSTFQQAVTDSESLAVSSVSAVSQRKGNEVDQVIAPTKLRLLGKGDEVVNKDYKSVEQQPANSSIILEDSNAHRMKFQRHGSASAQAKKSKGKKDDSGLAMPGFTGKGVNENEDIISSIISEQVQKMKQSKGNQELHDELKLKADELEKLFAVHKLRLPVNQSNATRRSKSVEAQEQIANLASWDSLVELSTPHSASTKVVDKPSHSDNIEKFVISPSIQQLEAQEFDKTPKQNLYSFGVSDDSRGKLYDKYMQKRDAKLKVEWSSNKAAKEARIKAMEDSFERSRSEMKIKFAGSADRQDSHCRAEKLKSFSSQSAIRLEQPIHSFVSDEDEEQAENGQGRLTSETYLAVGSSRRSVQNKKVSNNGTVSSTPRTVGAQASRSSSKASGSSAVRRKQQPENPLAQSVPNFSDLRKENTKPSTTSSKGAGRSQVRTYTRSKSSSDDVLSLEENLRRPRHVRKGSANPLEMKDLTSLNFEDVEHEDELSRRAVVGSLLRKGNTSSIPRTRASFAAKILVNEDEELKNTNIEEEDLESVVDEKYGNMDNGNLKSTNSVSEIGAMRVPSEVDPGSMSEMPTALPSTFRSMVSVLDSPGESPGSWHSRMHNPYSFQHEISDFDASVDSPIGSPAYWNTNDSDAARMRKKWGAAQKPIIDSSHGQSRKESKGLKRFLNFGRKNRGPDSLADCVSATTSEGDDDMEDGKDLAKWSSEDLRKSRMGFSHYNLDDGFSETDSVGEKARGFPSSIPTAPMNFKLKEDQFSGSALKGLSIDLY
ncbi:hypothetical protein V2J09_004641 [Rumex salicifolius]